MHSTRFPFGPGDPGLLAASLAAAPALCADTSKVFRYAFRVAETTFDPAEASDLYSSNIFANIFESPLEYDYLARPLKLVPNTLAEMPAVTEGGTLYTMRVKPGIRFADDAAFKGAKRELTAEDYVYSIKRQFDPKVKSPNLYLLEGQIVGMDEVLARARKENRFDFDVPVEGLRALDRYTWQVRLKQPNYNFMYYLAYCNLTCAVAREVVDSYAGRVGEHPGGHGPVSPRVLEALLEDRARAQPGISRGALRCHVPARRRCEGAAIAAAGKGRGLPMVDRDRGLHHRGAAAALARVLNNEHDFIERVPEEFANVAFPGGVLAPNLQRRGMVIERNPGMELTYSYFAMKDPVGRAATRPRRSHLRRAMVLGQDVGAEISIARKSQAIPAHSPIGPGASGYDPEFRSTARSTTRPSRRRCSTCSATWIATATACATCRARIPATSASPSRSSTPRRPTRTRSRSTRTGRRTWMRSASTCASRRRSGPTSSRPRRPASCRCGARAGAPPFPDADVFFVMLYGPNSGQANHSRFQLPEFDRLYLQAKRLPDGPERNAIYREMNRLFLVYAPWRLGTHRILSDISQPWTIGYRRHPVMRGWWKYIDIDQPKYASANGN
jgi:hypothetical protein